MITEWITVRECQVCYRPLPLNQFYGDKTKPEGIRTWCNHCLGKYSRRRNRLVKSEVLSHYPPYSLHPYCLRCGETNIKKLVLDHVDGGGNKHKEELGVWGCNFYKWLKENNYPQYPRLQVLCADCNAIKQTENGERRRKPRI